MNGFHAAVVRCAIAGGIFWATLLTARAAEYAPADALLKRMRAPVTQPVQAPKSLLTPLQQELKAFAQECAKLAPADAGAKWLVLLDHYFAVENTPQEVNGSTMLNNFDDVIAVLPGPESWPAIREGIEARPPGDHSIRAQSLRLLAHLLVRDNEAIEKDLDQIGPLLKDPVAAEKLRNVVLRSVNANDPALKLKTFTETLDLAEKPDPNTAMRERALEVPDLVTLAGPEKAEQLLRRALVLPVYVQIKTGAQTVRLARKLALELVDQLKSPPWMLVNSLDSIDLYEALNKKFPTSDQQAQHAARVVLGSGGNQYISVNDAEDRNNARLYYFLALVAKGRTDDAAKVAKEFGGAGAPVSETALRSLERAGATEAVYKFIAKLIADDPNLGLWDEYTELAAHLGKSEEVLAAARKAAATHDNLHWVLINALLAADQPDEAADALSKMLRLVSKPEDGFEGAQKLLAIGHLLGHHDWEDEAVGSILAYTKSRTANPAQASASTYELRSAIESLRNADRGADAATALSDSIATLYQASKVGGRPENVGANQSDLLRELVGIYYGAGRLNDVLTILDQFPNWGASDLAEMNGEQDSEGQSIGMMAAAALVAAGHADEARLILHELLYDRGGYDPAYELLLRIDGDKAIPFLDELFSRDRFEERPLIWKAKLLLDQKKLDDAQSIIERAIAIDPSDGEQGVGSRMRAYSVYADVLDAKGNADKAEAMRAAVTAIRLSEKADAFYNAGLLRHAIKLYQEALGHFQDAYCIQSRLAIQMAKLGMFDAAAEHYRKAYELMPESFGRVESHCFGCEHAFEGDQAQGIAEKVFTQLAAKEPNKPQVFYLLGYLRIQQWRYTEALDATRQAVKLDPDYLNAWNQIEELESSIDVPAADQDAAALNILRLDPLGRHHDPNVDEIEDLAGLWNAASTAAKLQRTPATTLYPLAASAQAMRQQPREDRDFQLMRSLHDEVFSGTPGERIAKVKRVEMTLRLIESQKVE